MGNLKVIAIGYGRQLFDAENKERQRMEACATMVGEYHMIVFTNRRDDLQTISLSEKNLYIYPTAARTKFGQLIKALQIGLKLTAQDKQWVITTQDPFEAGFVGYLLALVRKCPLNIQEHGDFFSTKFWRRDARLNRLRHFLGLFLLRRATTVRVVSERIKDTLVKLGVEEKRIYKLAVRSDSNFNNEIKPYDYGFPEEAIVILSIGRLVRQKNLPLLIRSFSTIKSRKPECRLVLVGSGPEEKYLKKLVSDLNLEDVVKFIAWSDSPESHYLAADAYALASNWEGWGRVLVEAKMALLPAVTTDVGCAGESFINNHDGFIVPVNDEKLFTEKLMQLVSDEHLRREFRHNLEANDEATITLEAYATLWAEIFTKTWTFKNQ